MFFKLIACNVFFREICGEAAGSRHVFDMEFTEKGEHAKPEVLRESLQKRIDAADASGKAYDAVLLAYGLCGNALAGITGRSTRLVVPRAHDCCTIFLGSKERFKKHFQDNPSRPFSSAGYRERGDSYLRTSDVYAMIGLGKTFREYEALYGGENARYIMETLNPVRETGKESEIFFIDMPGTAFLGFAETCRKEAESEGKAFTCVRGDPRLIKNLLNPEAGGWNAGDYLVLEPGEKIVPVYDWDQIIRAG
ncbi:MAG: DUF1638 domain-containing protein [Spirochaetales bacterium]|jgi:hypothetical protein|nr:DUF1638 domain-containing protein [Spirochaetales bacterium]